MADRSGPGVGKAETMRTALAELVRRRRQAAAVDFFTSVDLLADLRYPGARAKAWH